MDALEWARAHGASGEAELENDRPWARTTQIGELWLKECKPVQAYEPRLTAQLYERWPDRVTEVVAHDEARGWLLMRDAGGDGPSFAAALPLYAELQQGESAHADDHLTHGVPDVRVATLPAFYEEICAEARLSLSVAEFEELCGELRPLPPTVQHDDLHLGNVSGIRVLDWGDTSISHPFFSLVVLYWNGDLTEELRAAYLEPWGGAAADFELALRIGGVAHLFKWMRIREAMSAEERVPFDEWFPRVLEKVAENL